MGSSDRMASVEMRSRRAPSSKKAKPERSRVKSRSTLPLPLQSSKSLSQGFRFAGGSPSSKRSSMEEARGKNDSKDSKTNVAFLDEADTGSLELNDVSPYSSRTTSREERSLEGEEDGSSEVETSRLPAVSPSRIESRWSDTSSYGAKKVSLWFFFTAMALFILLVRNKFSPVFHFSVLSKRTCVLLSSKGQKMQEHVYVSS